MEDRITESGTRSTRPDPQRLQRFSAIFWFSWSGEAGIRWTCNRENSLCSHPVQLSTLNVQKVFLAVPPNSVELLLVDSSIHCTSDTRSLREKACFLSSIRAAIFSIHEAPLGVYVSRCNANVGCSFHFHFRREWNFLWCAKVSAFVDVDVEEVHVFTVFASVKMF